MNPVPRGGQRPATAHAAARRAWHGLIQALFGPEPGHPRHTAESWKAYAGLGLATLALCIVNVATLRGVVSAHGPLQPGVGQLPPDLAQQVLAVVVVAPLLLAARYPMLAWRLGLVALLLAPLAPAAWWGGWPWGPPQLVALFVPFCLAGLRQQRPELSWMWALTLIPWLLWLTADVSDLNGPISATIVFTAATVAVDSVSSQLGAQQALTTQTARTAEEQARRAVLEERARIARELHDVVAHHLSLIAVRAESAPYRLSDLPDPGRDEFASLSGIAREALSDMRRLLGVLRQDQPAVLTPQPVLADVSDLVAAARRAGLSVELSVPATLDEVPSGVGLCAYRIVQESLSNASQHAPGSPVRVSVDRSPAAVLLEVANGPGAPGSAQQQQGPGHGLTGMRERVALLGGSLSAGPAADGGFVVSAVLPLTAAADQLAGAS